LEQKILVVDSNYLCHRAFHTTGPLSYNETPTGVIFGFLNQLFTLGKAVRPDEVVFVWDSRKSLRKKRYPFYKDRNKTETPDQELLDAFAQFRLLRTQILPELGFCNNFIQGGYEADDIIAKIVMSHAEHQEFITASGDADLFQLLDYTDVYSMPSTKEIKTVTRESFTAEHGITPNQWVQVKQIAGCTSDTVPGIKGVGEKTAIKYLKGELKEDSVKARAIQSGQDIIDRNEWLVKLPLPGTALPEMNPSCFQKEKLRQVCKTYGFTKWQTDYNRLDEWAVFYGKN